jgi:hypothetical protein
LRFNFNSKGAREMNVKDVKVKEEQSEIESICINQFVATKKYTPLLSVNCFVASE